MTASSNWAATRCSPLAWLRGSMPEHGIAIDMRNFFDAPTAAELAVFIDEVENLRRPQGSRSPDPSRAPRVGSAVFGTAAHVVPQSIRTRIGSRPYSGSRCGSAERSMSMRCKAHSRI